MSWKLSRKGQGISLNAIVIAVLALVVLVVLVMVFTGRMGIFQSKIGGAAKAELQAMQFKYGACHPSTTREAAFTRAYEEILRDKTLTPEAEQEALSDEVQLFEGDINTCKNFESSTACLGVCSWR